MGEKLFGFTEPRIYTPPLAPLEPRNSETEARTLGYNCIDFAEEVLQVKLLPWQKWLLVHALELDEAGKKFRYRTILVLVARQNGKSTVAQVLALWAMYVLGVPLVLGTAQDLDTAEELWADAVALAEATDGLAELIEKVVQTNGKKSLNLIAGSRYKVRASTRKGARGLTGDLILLDELREHTTWDAWAAITKTTRARRKSQVWALSNAGDDFSVVLMKLRRDAHALLGDPDGINEDYSKGVEGLEQKFDVDPVSVESSALGIFEWSADPERNHLDRVGWQESNPSLGFLIDEATMASEAVTDPLPVFRTESLCQWESGGLQGPFANGAWEACADVDGEIAVGSQLVYGIDVAWTRDMGWIGVGGLRGDGRLQVEIAAARPGGAWIDWIPKWFEPLADVENPVRVVVPSRGQNPVAAVIPRLEQMEGVEVVRWGGSDFTTGCGMLYDLVMAADPEADKTETRLKPLAHRSQEALNLAAGTAAQRATGDGWYWDRRNSPHDVAPLIAVTGVVWDLNRIRDDEPKPSVYEHGVMDLV